MSELENVSAVKPAATPAVLNIEGLELRVQSDAGVQSVVRNLSLAVQRGETFALVGESGCGKSMTAMAILRLLPEAAWMQSGQIALEGLELPLLPEQQMQDVRGKRISVIFQEPSTSLNPVMSIGRQISEVIRRHGVAPAGQERARAIKWLERVGIPGAAQRYDDFPFQFSGGQKQRIMIAIALAAEPDLLVADEPTTALDVTVQAQILQLLADIQKEMGLAILLITHDLLLVKQYADYVALMRHGQIVEAGLASQFFLRPSHPYARELLNAIPTFEKRGRPLSRAPAPIEAVPPRNSGKELVLDIQGLSVSYKQAGSWWRRLPVIPVVKDLSLQLHKGETLALVGESGCGKSTVARTLMRLLDHQAQISGQVQMQGQNVLQVKGKALRQLRSRLQIIFQDPYGSLDPRMMVGDILLEGLTALRPELDTKARRKRIETLVDQVGLPKNALDRYAHEFSGGQRQRIAIARALAVEPAVLICDEPTSALDVSVQAQILDLMRELQMELGLAYLFITHNFGVVEYLADRIAIMAKGRIVEQGSAQHVLFHPQEELTQRLLAAVPR
ncbi:ABC transporter ATP-binding protein [Alcaligenes phenolicus]|uniref:Dipeptide ABC transporter ATP-binding protein n=1 Tax=Alcaligenes phenolicus TaxID=232846 RepID=A0AAW5VUA2_9BURK|nr:dipeptide ABC transporter ATP-binding protein [Alcaligenes phenolicus]MCX5566132.1 dipeptide ABC transporter ATP-binding protein [Alcaligenes phenolicus]